MPRKRNSAKSRAKTIYIHISAEGVPPRVNSKPKSKKKAAVRQQIVTAPPNHVEAECVGIEVIIVED